MVLSVLMITTSTQTTSFGEKTTNRLPIPFEANNIAPTTESDKPRIRALEPFANVGKNGFPDRKLELDGVREYTITNRCHYECKSPLINRSPAPGGLQDGPANSMVNLALVLSDVC
jgi:hypothetical protein